MTNVFGIAWRAVLGMVIAVAAAVPAAALTFTVTTTDDSGAGSLRQAILDANSHLGADSIVFKIPGAGVHTIALASALPDVTDPVTIDGYSQPGSSANTNPTGQGLNTVLTIEIDGTAVDATTPCLTIQAGNLGVLAMVVQGLVINRCAKSAIRLGSDADSAQIIGNFIGTDSTGESRPAGPQSVGIHIDDGASGVVVGGETPVARNLISGFDSFGILTSTGSGSSVIQGNLIGTDSAGTAAIPNGTGIVAGGIAWTIGGTTAADRNVISGNTVGIEAADGTIRGNVIGTDATGTRPLGNALDGIRPSTLTLDGTLIEGNVISSNGNYGINGFSSGASTTFVRGNFIGTDETGTIALGNAVAGITNFNGVLDVGGTAPGEGNVIAHNGRNGANDVSFFYGGVTVVSHRVTIRGNRIFDNEPLGIDLLADGLPGVTVNDIGDLDSGPNDLQNFPLITSVVPGASTTHIEGILNSSASTTYDIDVFSSSCLRRPHDDVEGETFLGTLPVTTDAIGNATFALDVPVVIAAADLVSATATDPNGNTSEFSPRILFAMDPGFGPPAGDVQVTITGTQFEDGVTVTVGGVPATGVTVANPGVEITAFMPALPAGSVNDVVVVDPSGIQGRLRDGWLADFLDVPGGQQFHAFVVTLVESGIAVGIGGGLYGVDSSTLRQQMAVFILKGKHGLCYTPPPCKGVFPDVPCPSPFADWIEAMAAEGITSGCGGGDFCPQSPVRRDQMAVFLLKAEHGSNYVPPDCTGAFADVPCPSTFANWIEQLAAEMITGGCGGGNYCPLNNNTRGQMAVFISKTFNLQ